MSSSSELGGLDAGPAADVVDSKTVDAVQQRIDAGHSFDRMPRKADVNSLPERNNQPADRLDNVTVVTLCGPTYSRVLRHIAHTS